MTVQNSHAHFKVRSWTTITREEVRPHVTSHLTTICSIITEGVGIRMLLGFSSINSNTFILSYTKCCATIHSPVSNNHFFPIQMKNPKVCKDTKYLDVFITVKL